MMINLPLDGAIRKYFRHFHNKYFLLLTIVLDIFFVVLKQLKLIFSNLYPSFHVIIQRVLYAMIILMLFFCFACQYICVCQNPVQVYGF